MSQTQIIIQSIHDFVQQRTNNSLTLFIQPLQYIADALSDNNHFEVIKKHFNLTKEGDWIVVAVLQQGKPEELFSLTLGKDNEKLVLFVAEYEIEKDEYEDEEFEV